MNLTRREMLRVSGAAALCGAGLLRGTPVAAAEVDWLDEVTTPPDPLPNVERLGTLAPLLVDESGAPIRTRADWERHRTSLRDRWRKFLGPMPERPKSTEFKVLKELRTDGLHRQLLDYEGEAGRRVQGWLIRPLDRKPGKHPALVSLHATTNQTIDQEAGLVGNETRWLGSKMAARGFTVFCPRNYLWQDVDSIQQGTARFRESHPETRGMHKMLWDAQRAVDLLAAMPDVDPQRIGSVGHSLGAKEVLYLAAFDERIRATVSSEGGLGFRSTNWNAEWYLGKAIDDESFPLNHHQLLALIAPRPFLVLGGETGPGAADGARSWPLIVPARAVWDLYGRPLRVGLYNHGKGHDIPPHVFDRLAAWLTAYV